MSSPGSPSRSWVRLLPVRTNKTSPDAGVRLTRRKNSLRSDASIAIPGASLSPALTATASKRMPRPAIPGNVGSRPPWRAPRFVVTASMLRPLYMRPFQKQWACPSRCVYSVPCRGRPTQSVAVPDPAGELSAPLFVIQCRTPRPGAAPATSPTGLAHPTRSPVRINEAALRTTSLVRKFNVPASSSGPQRPVLSSVVASCSSCSSAAALGSATRMEPVLPYESCCLAHPARQVLELARVAFTQRHSGAFGDQPAPVTGAHEAVAVAAQGAQAWVAVGITMDLHAVTLGRRGIAVDLDDRRGQNVNPARVMQQVPLFLPANRLADELPLVQQEAADRVATDEPPTRDPEDASVREHGRHAMAVLVVHAPHEQLHHLPDHQLVEKCVSHRVSFHWPGISFSRKASTTTPKRSRPNARTALPARNFCRTGASRFNVSSCASGMLKSSSGQSDA